jgi:hypothetical protein
MDQSAPATAERLIAELDAQGDPPAPPAPNPRARPNYSHDALIDLMLTRPDLTQTQIARSIGYTPAWLSTIMASDSFQAKYAARYAQLVDPVAAETIEARFKAVAIRAGEILMEKLDRPAAAVPDQLALSAFNLASKAAGYGIKPPVINLNVGESLEKLGGNLVALLRTKRAEVIEGESHAITSHAEAT